VNASASNDGSGCQPALRASPRWGSSLQPSQALGVVEFGTGGEAPVGATT